MIETENLDIVLMSESVTKIYTLFPVNSMLFVNL